MANLGISFHIQDDKPIDVKVGGGTGYAVVRVEHGVDQFSLFLHSHTPAQLRDLARSLLLASGELHKKAGPLPKPMHVCPRFRLIEERVF